MVRGGLPIPLPPVPVLPSGVAALPPDWRRNCRSCARSFRVRRSGSLSADQVPAAIAAVFDALSHGDEEEEEVAAQLEAAKARNVGMRAKRDALLREGEPEGTSLPERVTLPLYLASRCHLLHDAACRRHGRRRALTVLPLRGG